MKKHKCCECNSIAQYFDGRENSKIKYYCSEHLPKSERNHFGYCKNGFPIYNEEQDSFVAFKDILKSFGNVKMTVARYDHFDMKDALEDIFMKNKESKHIINTNLLLSKFGHYVQRSLNFNEFYSDPSVIRGYYNNIKNEIKKISFKL